jgi:hypothetical protein
VSEYAPPDPYTPHLAKLRALHEPSPRSEAFEDRYKQDRMRALEVTRAALAEQRCEASGADDDAPSDGELEEIERTLGPLSEEERDEVKCMYVRALQAARAAQYAPPDPYEVALGTLRASQASEVRK